MVLDLGAVFEKARNRHIAQLPAAITPFGPLGYNSLAQCVTLEAVTREVNHRIVGTNGAKAINAVALALPASSLRQYRAFALALLQLPGAGELLGPRTDILRHQ